MTALARKPINEEQLFLDTIKTLVKNLLIDNVNFKNGYYVDKSVYFVIDDTKERSEYILEKMESMKHLIGL